MAVAGNEGFLKSMASTKEFSKKARQRISSKISKIILEEGLKPSQAAAIAYNLERRGKLKKNPSDSGSGEQLGPVLIKGIKLSEIKKEAPFLRRQLDHYKNLLKEALKATEGESAYLRERRINQFVGGLAKNDPRITDLHTLKLLCIAGVLDTDKKMVWALKGITIDSEKCQVSVDGTRWYTVYDFSDKLGEVNAVSVFTAVNNALEKIFERHNLYR